MLLSKYIKHILIICILSISFTTLSCKNKDSSNNSSLKEKTALTAQSKYLQMRMADSSVSMRKTDNKDEIIYQKILVDIKEIQAHHEEKGWLSISDNNIQYDLMLLKQGLSAIIFDKPIEAGNYTQVRLILNDRNEVFVKGKPYKLKVPSGLQTGIKLVTPFTISEGKMTEIKLDLDIDKSINLNKGQGFILKPVIKIQEVNEYDAIEVVGSTGGNVSSLDGDINLSIPPGALDSNIIITVVEPASFPPMNNQNMIPLGKVYDIGPDGTTFNTSIQISFNYNENDVFGKGMEQNIKLYRYDQTQAKWIEISSYINIYTNTIYANINHFSLYTRAITATCDDGIMNGGETGIDCGGVCLAECVDCNEYNFGYGINRNYYSFNDSDVIAVAESVLTEYADFLTNNSSKRPPELKGLTRDIIASDINTPDIKIEAVSYYVYKYMAWMQDEGDWQGAQTAAVTVNLSISRSGNFSSAKKGDADYVYDKCDSIKPNGDGRTYANEIAKYCGDCEDFAILRASLLRHLGVAQHCVMMGDYHANWDHPSVPPPFYDYENAEDLFIRPSASKKGSHTFNTVIHRNKYRLLDYLPIYGDMYYNTDWNYFKSGNDWSEEHHRVDNVWNDHFGQHWLGLTPPETKIHNYPFSFNTDNTCYEAGKNYWTHRTLYADICP